MNSSKRAIFKKNVQARFDAINKRLARLTKGRATKLCDRCRLYASGVERLRNNVPVLFLCDECNSRLLP